MSEAATLPLPHLMRNLHSSENGLSIADAIDILKRIGANRIDTAERKSLLLAFIERFRNPLVLILLFAAVVSAFTGDVPSFLIIAVIVLMSVILDVNVPPTACVNKFRCRAGCFAIAVRFDIAATEIVPGDMVLLAAGDLVPADARLVEARDLHVDEALLTGEAYLPKKR